MRLPKTVQICGMTYSVSTNKTSFGGGGDTSDLSLWIGTANKNPEKVFEIYLHEIMEIVACERGDRYGSGVSDDSCSL